MGGEAQLRSGDPRSGWPAVNSGVGVTWNDLRGQVERKIFICSAHDHLNEILIQLP